MDVCTKPERTLVVFDYEGLSGHHLKALQQTERLLRKQKGAQVFSSLAQAED